MCPARSRTVGGLVRVLATFAVLGLVSSAAAPLLSSFGSAFGGRTEIGTSLSTTGPDPAAPRIALGEGTGPTACAGRDADTQDCPLGVSLNNSTWSAAPGGGPPARYRTAMAFDPVDGYVLLFGGCGRVCALSDTWVYASGIWTNLTGTTGATPPGRSDASMAYYPGTAGNGYVVMFGGFGPEGFLGDTWGFSGGRWTLIVPPAGSSSPPPRAGASLAFDAATASLVLFGGSANYLGKTLLNDSWSYSDGLWSQLRPSVSPPARTHSSMAYDPEVGAAVLFGGTISSGIAKDTWAFSGGNWTRMTVPTAPSSREGAALVYDPALSMLVLFGGLGRLGFDSDTWVFTGATWVEESLPTSPPGCAGMAATFDTGNDYLLLYGGWNLSAFSSSSWVFGNNVTFSPAGTAANDSARGGELVYGFALGLAVALPVLATASRRAD